MKLMITFSGWRRGCGKPREGARLEIINYTLHSSPQLNFSSSGKKKLSDVIDAGNREGRQERKRKAALEQSNILKKIKKRTYQ